MLHIATRTVLVLRRMLQKVFQHFVLMAAIEWYRKSAALGNCYAQNSLGYIHEEGLGLQRDEHAAVFWYTLSANQGYPWAQCNLGFCLQNGMGIEKDLVTGAAWYEKVSTCASADLSLRRPFKAILAHSTISATRTNTVSACQKIR